MALVLAIIPWPIRLGTATSVVPAERRAVSAFTGGVVQRVYVHEGDRVSAGQPIAQLDDGDDRVKLASAQTDMALAAREVSDAEYRGEAYVAEGGAMASVVSWTPNDVEVRVDHARPGDHVVLNQNWDPGWAADGAPAVAYRDAVASVVGEPAQTVHFRYWPHSLGWGLALFAATAAAVAVWLLRRPEARP